MHGKLKSHMIEMIFCCNKAQMEIIMEEPVEEGQVQKTVEAVAQVASPKFLQSAGLQPTTVNKSYKSACAA